MRRLANILLVCLFATWLFSKPNIIDEILSPSQNTPHKAAAMNIPATNDCQLNFNSLIICFLIDNAMMLKTSEARLIAIQKLTIPFVHGENKKNHSAKANKTMKIKVRTLYVFS